MCCKPYILLQHICQSWRTLSSELCRSGLWPQFSLRYQPATLKSKPYVMRVREATICNLQVAAVLHFCFSNSKMNQLWCCVHLIDLLTGWNLAQVWQESEAWARSLTPVLSLRVEQQWHSLHWHRSVPAAQVAPSAFSVCSLVTQAAHLSSEGACF